MQTLNTHGDIHFNRTKASTPLTLVVYLGNQFHTLRYNLSQTQQLIIGRGDPTKNWQPDVDLRNYGGQALGVSRLHAAIKQHENGIYLIDLFSFNGTFINEIMLFPYQPQPVGQGDTIRIGQLKIFIRITEPAQEAKV